MTDNERGLTIDKSIRLLQQHNLLREIIQGNDWTLDRQPVEESHKVFSSITYDTRRVREGSLLCVKGHFKAEFLRDIDSRGLACYVAQEPYNELTQAPGLIVSDVHKAMCVLGAEFYGNPQHALTLIGITGTKGKTTTAYFTQAILNAYSHQKAALLSSVANCVDGSTYEASSLTTPESLDLYALMRDMVDNGMQYLVMEVSSQAYKVERVYNLTFDIGAFLNISPDHISPIEHPTFEDYLFCKRQLIANSRTLILGADCAYNSLLRADAHKAHIPVVSFALHHENSDTPADIVGVEHKGKPELFTMVVRGEKNRQLRLAMDGQFNREDAVAAIALALQTGVPADSDALSAVENVRVPGRMEKFVGADGVIGYVDFAHNFVSTKALVDEILREYGSQHPRITLVSGSTGGKALDRREGIVQGAIGRVESFIFTTDDPNFDNPQSIAEEMQSYVTDPNAQTQVIVSREKSIVTAVEDARRHAERLNIVLVIGKGDETGNVINGKHVPYAGDAVLLERALHRATT